MAWETRTLRWGLALVSLVALLALASTARADPSFWDGQNNFLYRQSVTFTNTGAALTNHAVPINVSTGALIAAGKLQADCDDLRFRTLGEVAVRYWIESGCGGTARVWVKVPSIPAGGSTTLNMFYGHTGIGEGSDVNSTFVPDVIRTEVSDCDPALTGAFCSITSHAAADAVRDRAADLCAFGIHTKIDYGYACTNATALTNTRDSFATEYRFLFVPDVTGLWAFHTRANNWSELATSVTDEALSTSHSLVVTNYGDVHTELSANVSMTAGQGKWFSFVSSDRNGLEEQRLRITRPGGSTLLFSTANFPTHVFSRGYTSAPVTFSFGAEESLPGAPTSVDATTGYGEVDVTWAAPVTDGGSPILGYHVLANLGDAFQIVANVSGHSATVPDLADDTVYAIRVRAWNARGHGQEVELSGCTSAPMAQTPTGLTATRGNGSVTLTWDALTPASCTLLEGFHVYAGPEASPALVATTTDPANTSFTVNGLANGTSYNFRVSAWNDLDEGPLTSVVSATPAAIPDPPKDLEVFRTGDSLYLEWGAGLANGDSIDSYRLWMGTSSGATTLHETLGSFATWTIVDGLVLGQTYFFNVTAVNGVGESLSSNEVSENPAIGPSAPTLTLDGVGNGTISLSWTVPTSDGGEPLLHYALYETWPGTEEFENGTRLGTSTTLPHPNGASRTFRVSGVNEAGTGDRSNGITISAAGVPYPPGNVATSAGNRTATVSWTASPNDGGRTVTDHLVRCAAPCPAPHVWSATSPFELTGLANGTTYSFTVTAVNEMGESNSIGAFGATPAAPRPDPPAGLTAARGNGYVALSWTPGHDGGAALTGYQIWRGTSSGGATLLATTGSGANTSFVANGLANGQAYFFNVTAVNAKGTSASSNEASATPATLPSAPTALAAVAGNHSVALSWTPGATGGSALVGYDVFRVVGGTATLFAQTTNGANASFTANGLANGELAIFSVRARNGVGSGAMSGEASATPRGAPFPPILTGATRGDGQVALSWTIGATDGTPITSTKLLQGTSPGALAEVATLAAGAASHTRTGLTNGVTYYFALRHTSAAGTGGLSNEMSAKPARAPGAPTGLAASFGDGTISLTWNAPEDAGGEPVTSYGIERGPSADALQPLATLGANTSFVSAGLTNGATYVFRVTATNAVGAGAPSATVSQSPARAPDAPSNLTAQAGSREVALDWDAPANDGGRALTGYRISRAAGSGAMTFLDDIGTNTSYVASGLVDGVAYRFRVAALNAVGAGAQTPDATATPLSPPGAPATLAATMLQTTIRLDWTPPAELGGVPVGQYRIYASDTPGGARWLVATVAGASLTYTDAAPPASARHYVVRALNVAGEGPASPEALGTTQPNPLQPTAPDTYRTCTRDDNAETAACTQGSSQNVVKVAAGGRHTCALLQDGRADCWGDDAAGQSGDHLAGHRVTALAAGTTHTCALLANGNVDCYGANSFGKAASYLGGNATAVSTGGTQTCFVRLDGTAACQGANGYGQSPALVPGVRAVAAGGYHTCFLLTSRHVQCVGLDDRGQAADEAQGDVSTLTAGGFHTCVLTLSQDVRCWGGLTEAVPAEVQGVALQLASGRDHACARIVGGDVVCWGSDRDGQSAGYAGGDAIHIAAGDSHTCAVLADATIHCWGAEGTSDHGQGTAYPTAAPTVPSSGPAPLARSPAVSFPVFPNAALLARTEEA